MALSKVNFNSMNVTPAASKAIKFNSSNNGLETGDIGGNLVLLETKTASGDGTLDFTSGIDSTYKEYQFHFANIHPATGSNFTFQADTGTNTNYNIAMTTTSVQAYHTEDNSSTGVSYKTSTDQGNGTGFQILTINELSDENDGSMSGILTVYEPSSSTFVKHFIANTNHANNSGASPTNQQHNFIAGYFNTTTALTRFRFKMSSGNIDAGTIKLYGVL